ncbi:MAG: hypothetical protein ACTSPV_12890, partial [Candidatus Hodarchaeales archaeon]
IQIFHLFPFPIFYSMFSPFYLAFFIPSPREQQFRRNLTFQIFEKNPSFHERGEKECLDICSRLNRIFSSSPLASYFGFQMVLITCPDENARGSRMLRTLFYKSLTSTIFDSNSFTLVRFYY